MKFKAGSTIKIQTSRTQGNGLRRVFPSFWAVVRVNVLEEEALSIRKDGRKDVRKDVRDTMRDMASASVPLLGRTCITSCIVLALVGLRAMLELQNEQGKS